MLSLPTLDTADDRLSALIISCSVDTKLIAVSTCLTRFSRAVDFALTRTSVPLDPLAFVEDPFEIQSGFLSIPEPVFYETDELSLQGALRMGALIFMKETIAGISFGITWVNQSGAKDEEYTFIHI